MDSVECLVVGAGVVGLAVARQLARAGRETIVVEREAAYGGGVSSRNSEVIHAGLYYPPGSLKARLCVQGKAMLYAWCAERGVPHRRCGKLVVATDGSRVDELRRLQATAHRNGVTDVAWLDAADARAIEPEVRCAAALWSPSSGIVDSHALMTSLLGDAQAAGAVLALASPVASAARVDGGWAIAVGDDPEPALRARWLVNCAGLGAVPLAAATSGPAAARVPRQRFAKGHYFSLSVRSPFTHLVYPLPDDGGLGVHLTLDLAGRGRFGPDVEWLPDGLAERDLDYAVDVGRAAAFEAQVRRFWPGLPDGALAPAYTGVRPKMHGPGEPAADFRIDGPDAHGCEGLVQLFGIESPGLTASLAIAEHVAGIVAATDRARAAARGPRGARARAAGTVGPLR